MNSVFYFLRTCLGTIILAALVTVGLFHVVVYASRAFVALIQ